MRPKTSAYAFFLRGYPRQSGLMLLFLVLGGIVETVGAVSIVPLLAGLFDKGPQASALVADIAGWFARMGLQPSLANTLLVLCAALVLRGALTFLAYSQVGYVEAEVTARLRMELLDNVLRARWSFFVAQPAGALSYALASEAPQAGLALRDFCFVISCLAQTGAYIAAGLFLSWQAMLAAALCGGLLLLAFRGLVRNVRTAGMRQAETLNTMTAVFVDGLGGTKPLKVMGAEDHFIRFLQQQTDRYKQAARLYVQNIGALTAAQEPVMAVLLAAGLYWARTLLGIDGVSLVTLAFFFQRAMSRFATAQQTYQQFVGYEGSLNSLQGKIDTLRSQRETRGAGRDILLESEIKLEGVAFSYGREPVLNGLDLAIPIGAVTVLQGSSGAGKTTVADLVTGLVTPQAGRITVDGVPLEEVDLARWRAQIGYVPQEVFLFNDTIRNNVALGRGISEERIVAALEQAGAWEFVAALPQGLDHVVGEQGRSLSGGQRQRLMIARALVGAPRLLVLDEATSGLDEATEREIWNCVSRLKASMAVLAISHQKAVLEIADRTIVLGGPPA